MSVNPNVSADCHASGSVAYIATIVRDDLMLKMCGHCLVKSTRHGTTHLDALVAQGWTIWPLKRATQPFSWFDAGTESTGRHFALDNF